MRPSIPHQTTGTMHAMQDTPAAINRTTMSASIGAERGGGDETQSSQQVKVAGGVSPSALACRGENKCRLITISPTEYHRYQNAIGAIIQRYCYYEALTLWSARGIFNATQFNETPRKVENESCERGNVWWCVRRKIRSRPPKTTDDRNGPKCAQQIGLQCGIFNAAPGRWRRSRGLLPTVASPL